mmetsp:Transcript_28739/g.29128  ORF Transcript_28739/g.29128 Transcript_28739/m.29128 type:complete len:84 (+) Transcript_28739:46-297(+)
MVWYGKYGMEKRLRMRKPNQSKLDLFQFPYFILYQIMHCIDLFLSSFTTNNFPQWIFVERNALILPWKQLFFRIRLDWMHVLF